MPSTAAFSIALLAPYGNLGPLFARAAQGLPCHLTTRLGVALDDAVAEARRMLEQPDRPEDRPEVICSRGGTADYLRSQLDIPVVDIPTSALDLLRTLLPFRDRIRKVAFFHYQDPLPEVQVVARTLGLEIAEYFFHTREDMHARMLEAAAQGAELGVGGALVADMRSVCGVDGLVLEAGEDAICRCLNEALTIARIRRRDQQRHARIRTIVDTITEGIIATDAENCLTLVNPAAEKLLGLQAANVLGVDARSVVPNTRTWEVLHQGHAELNQLQDIGGQTIVTNRVPVRSNGAVIGVVCTFSGAERIRQAERRLRTSRASFRARYRLEDIWTNDPGMKEVLTLARCYARRETTVLVQGESGTGKELVAQGMHLASPRRDGPFVAVNCAAIPPELLESELFGYEEGAFTGARRSGKPGYFEMAHDGTLFLDEIGELPLPLQARLLRVLQEREVLRLGGSQSVQVNIRVLCASNRDLAREVAKGRFREDLFYRCSVLQLVLPPLRQRGRDCLLLARKLLAAHLPAAAQKADEVLQELESSLLGHNWPGNIRELESCMERLALSLELFPGRTVAEHWRHSLGRTVRRAGNDSLPWNPEEIAPLKVTLEQAEQAAIARALAACPDMSEAARRLGVGRTTLWRKLHRDQRSASDQD